VSVRPKSVGPAVQISVEWGATSHTEGLSGATSAYWSEPKRGHYTACRSDVHGWVISWTSLVAKKWIVTMKLWDTMTTTDFTESMVIFPVPNSFLILSRQCRSRFPRWVSPSTAAQFLASRSESGPELWQSPDPQPTMDMFSAKLCAPRAVYPPAIEPGIEWTISRIDDFIYIYNYIYIYIYTYDDVCVFYHIIFLIIPYFPVQSWPFPTSSLLNNQRVSPRSSQLPRAQLISGMCLWRGICTEFFWSRESIAIENDH